MWKQKLLYSTGWRDAWTNWILLPITPSCSQAPFKAPDFLSALWKGGVSLLAGSFYFHFCTSHQSDHAGPSAASPISQCSRWCGSAITDQLTGLIRICPWYSQQHTGEIVFMRGGSFCLRTCNTTLGWDTVVWVPAERQCAAGDRVSVTGHVLSTETLTIIIILNKYNSIHFSVVQTDDWRIELKGDVCEPVQPWSWHNWRSLSTLISADRQTCSSSLLLNRFTLTGCDFNF